MQQPGQLPMGMDIKDKILDGDTTFIAAADIKQTKKRKAIAQPIPQDLSLHVISNIIKLRKLYCLLEFFLNFIFFWQSNESNISSSSNAPRERPFGSGTPDTTNDDKVKKVNYGSDQHN